MATKASKSGGKSFSQKMGEIRRCNDLRARIKAFCKVESLTQPQFGEKIRVTAKQMSLFMTGASLTGSEVYAKAMAYLKTRMPLSKVSDSERAGVSNNKWIVTFG